MGYWLKKRLHTESDVDANQTYRYKLPTVGLFSAFSFEVECQRYTARASTTENQQLAEAISKIELLSEGTKVLKSLRGVELQALNTFDFGRIVPFQHGEQANDYNLVNFYLLAGRGLQSKEYMFDMSRFSDPEIAITNAVTETTAEYWKVNTLTYRIYGWRWMGSPAPLAKGYMRADERVYYTTSAEDAEKVVDITLGKRIRRILIKGWTTRTSIAGHFSRVDLEVDEGAYSPIIIDRPLEWALQNVADYNLNLAHGFWLYLGQTPAASWSRSQLSYHVIPTITAWLTDQTSCPSFNGLEGGDIAFTEALAGKFFLMVDGAGPFHSLLLGFDKEPDLSDMLETADMGKLKLILTEAAASKVVSVVVEEEVLY